MLLRLKISGRLTLAGEAALRQWQETLEGRLRHLDVDAEALLVSAAADDLEAFGADGALRQTANVLSRLASDPANNEHAAARRALQMLYGYAANARSEGA